MSRKTIENAWSMLIKFGLKENLEKLIMGQLYMKNLKYYNELENISSNEYVGDKYDGHIVIQNSEISLYKIDSNELITKIETPILSLDLGYLQSPIFCMFMFDFRNCVKKDFEGNKLITEYQFSEYQREKLRNFGDYALIIKNGKEFITRIKNAFLTNNYNFSSGFVQYYNSNNVEQMRQINEKNSQIAFWKRDKYSYQQEYRILVYDSVEDFLSIDIGNISDITSLIKTDELLNIGFKITYNIEQV